MPHMSKLLVLRSPPISLIVSFESVVVRCSLFVSFDGLWVAYVGRRLDLSKNSLNRLKGLQGCPQVIMPLLCFVSLLVAATQSSSAQTGGSCL